MNDDELKGKSLSEKNQILKQRRENAKKYTKEQMEADIKKYELNKDFGIYIINEDDLCGREYSGYIIKKNNGTFDIVINGDRGIPTNKMNVNTINEAMAYLVLGLRSEKSKEEYYRSKYMRR